MHLPRDPGEWLFMAVLMAVLMAVGMLVVHGLRSHLGGHGGVMRPGIVMRVGTWAVSVLLRLGVRVSLLGPMMLLTVRGRRSGQPRTVPVDVHDIDGRRYLIATHGVGAWVINLRAAGEGTLRLGRTRIPFAATELAPEQAGPITRRALGTLVGSDGWRGSGVRNNLGVRADSADADYVRAAATHPVFEIVVAS
jgi:deazaflavin-dependent oxidoreductase (nitroreductase family)